MSIYIYIFFVYTFKWILFTFKMRIQVPPYFFLCKICASIKNGLKFPDGLYFEILSKPCPPWYAQQANGNPLFYLHCFFFVCSFCFVIFSWKSFFYQNTNLSNKKRLCISQNSVLYSDNSGYLHFTWRHTNILSNMFNRHSLERMFKSICFIYIRKEYTIRHF